MTLCLRSPSVGRNVSMLRLWCDPRVQRNLEPNVIAWLSIITVFIYYNFLKRQCEHSVEKPVHTTSFARISTLASQPGAALTPLQAHSLATPVKFQTLRKLAFKQQHRQNSREWVIFSLSVCDLLGLYQRTCKQCIDFTNCHCQHASWVWSTGVLIYLSI